MLLFSLADSPFRVEFSFGELIDRLENSLPHREGARLKQAQQDIEELKTIPALRDGISDISEINEHKDVIGRLLVDYFPPALTSNEIKAVSLPYSPVIFNHTKRFLDILSAAGPDFQFGIRDFDAHEFYVFSCCIILNDLYGTNLDFTRPLFYDIPMANGVIRHYRILYNADSLEVIPTERAIQLTGAEIKTLIDNFHDLELWKSMFPKDSYILRGFSIITLIDVTIENAVSLFKENLLTLNANEFQHNIESIFRSIYRNPDIRIGYAMYDENKTTFIGEGLGYHMDSFALHGIAGEHVKDILCNNSYHNLIVEKRYFAIADTFDYVDKFPDSALAAKLKKQNIRSVILAPVVKNDHVFGVLEVVSDFAGELNSVNANKLDVIMPFLTDTIERLVAQFQNRVQAVIQSNYTSLHPSVYWKFRDAARISINNSLTNEPESLPEIIFDNVYPFYGQVDIKGSSTARNESTRKDLLYQLKDVVLLIDNIESVSLPINNMANIRRQLEKFIQQLAFPVNAGTEQLITHYLESEVHPEFDQLSDHPFTPNVLQYFRETIKETGAYFTFRRMFDKTVTTINSRLAQILDESQVEAQQIFPHYFERFKTDGVDHSMYIGESIAPGKTLTPAKLMRIRLWQLEAICRMERAHFEMRDKLPYPLEVTTLILLYTMPLAIRFRMDEKRFDVDGSYNARFEIVKKRIDKAYIKGTTNRLTESGCISIVYSDEEEALEYRACIRKLQTDGLLEDEIEVAEVQDLQGVTGLKAFRVKFKRQERYTSSGT